MHNEDMPGNTPATKSDISRLAKHIVINQAGLTKLIEDVRQELRQTRSVLVTQMDGFMRKTRKVDVDQTFLIHRVDKLEKRVSTLESRDR